MTKLEMKKRVSEWNIQIGKLQNRNTEIFQEMQELARENGKTVYMSMQRLLAELIGTKDEYNAFNLYNEYTQNEGQFEALYSFLHITNNYEF